MPQSSIMCVTEHNEKMVFFGKCLMFCSSSQTFLFTIIDHKQINNMNHAWNVHTP